MHVKVTYAGKDSRLTEGFTYFMERLASGHLRFTSVGGRFSCLVNPDTSDVEFDAVDAPLPSPLKGWRNTFAVNLWNEVFVQRTVDGDGPAAAAEYADLAVAQFKGRWEGTTFLHNVEQAA